MATAQLSSGQAPGARIRVVAGRHAALAAAGDLTDAGRTTTTPGTVTIHGQVSINPRWDLQLTTTAYVPIDSHHHRSMVMYMGDDGEALGWTPSGLVRRPTVSTYPSGSSTPVSPPSPPALTAVGGVTLTTVASVSRVCSVDWRSDRGSGLGALVRPSHGEPHLVHDGELRHRQIEKCAERRLWGAAPTSRSSLAAVVRCSGRPLTQPGVRLAPNDAPVLSRGGRGLDKTEMGHSCEGRLLLGHGPRGACRCGRQFVRRTAWALAGS